MVDRSFDMWRAGARDFSTSIVARIIAFVADESDAAAINRYGTTNERKMDQSNWGNRGNVQIESYMLTKNDICAEKDNGCEENLDAIEPGYIQSYGIVYGEEDSRREMKPGTVKRTSDEAYKDMTTIKNREKMTKIVGI